MGTIEEVLRRMRDAMDKAGWWIPPMPTDGRSMISVIMERQMTK